MTMMNGEKIKPRYKILGTMPLGGGGKEAVISSRSVGGFTLGQRVNDYSDAVSVKTTFQRGSIHFEDVDELVAFRDLLTKVVDDIYGNT